MVSRSVVVVFIVFLAITGCKIRVAVPEGGSVITASGNYGCQSTEVCLIDIRTTDFEERFIAEANPGYFFRHWRSGHNSLCANGLEKCDLSTTWMAGNAEFESILASDEVYNLEPVFLLGTCEDISEQWDQKEKGKEVKYQKDFSRCSAFVPDSNHGIMRTTRNGKIISEIQWDMGVKGQERTWWTNGELKSLLRWQHNAMHGVQSYYYRSGILRQSQAFLEGVQHGPERIYFANGELKISRSFNYGELHGVVKTYASDGVLLKKRTYNIGIPEGRWRIYDDTGTLIRKGTRPPVLKDIGNGLIQDRVTGTIWTRDANLFKTLCDAGDPLAVDLQPQDAKDASEICARGGEMSWNDAKLWLELLNDNQYQGFSNWRLPTTEIDPTCIGRCDNSEMGQIYYRRLSNHSALENSGPFNNLQPDSYWSATLHPQWEDAFFFVFEGRGIQDSDNFENPFHVWPVRTPR